MVTCPTCGAERPDGDRFCGSCGGALPDPATQTQATEPIEAPVELDATPPGPVPHLGPALAVRLQGGRTGEFFPLTGQVTTIGRSPDCDIFLDDITVSRAHAQVREEPAGFVLVDDGSTNGTYVNRRVLEEAEILADGDEVQVGRFRLVFIA
ncbi:MAG: FHA domain-containing protein [Actinobacteria bacterium]|nr:FHA domain-containing protein [Actinomycetota bacterium]